MHFLKESDQVGMSKKERVEALKAVEIHFVDSPEFKDPSPELEMEMLQIPHIPLRTGVLPSESTHVVLQPLYNFPPISRKDHAQLFRAMNFMRRRFSKSQPLLHSRSPLLNIEQSEKDLAASSTIRETLITCNMRLIPTAGKSFLEKGMSLDEVFSHCSPALIRAVDNFDYSLGFTFSTFAVNAMFNELQRSCRRSFASKALTNGLQYDVLSTAEDASAVFIQEDLIEHLSDAIRQSLDTLNEREKIVIIRSFGLDGRQHGLLREIGEQLGLCKERVRQIKVDALDKLRENPIIQDFLSEL